MKTTHSRSHFEKMEHLKHTFQAISDTIALAAIIYLFCTLMIAISTL